MEYHSGATIASCVCVSMYVCLCVVQGQIGCQLVLQCFLNRCPVSGGSEGELLSSLYLTDFHLFLLNLLLVLRPHVTPEVQCTIMCNVHLLQVSSGLLVIAFRSQENQCCMSL